MIAFFSTVDYLEHDMRYLHILKQPVFLVAFSITCASISVAHLTIHYDGQRSIMFSIPFIVLAVISFGEFCSGWQKGK